MITYRSGLKKNCTNELVLPATSSASGMRSLSTSEILMVSGGNYPECEVGTGTKPTATVAPPLPTLYSSIPGAAK